MTSKINIRDLIKPYTLGIIGGGQLALMLVEAAKNRGLKVCVQTKSKSDPAALKADFIIEADPLQNKGNKNLIKESKKIIFENEWVKIDKLKQLGSDDLFIPKLEAIEPLVDRISQKRFIDRLKLPTPKWISSDLFKKSIDYYLENWDFPLMAKTFKGGYDGKGNKKLANKDELNNFISENNSDEWLIEEWIEFKNEFALIGSRDHKGKIRLFPMVETFQSQNVCDWVFSPAKINYEINLFALNIFSSIVNELDYVGVLGIEFFFGENGLLINEIAPRTHNSGHFSIEACSSSQFDQHICISSDIEPPDINLNSNGALMINLLGLKNNYPLSIEQRYEKLSEIKNACLHIYGKAKENVGRKMGHVTFLLNELKHEERLMKSISIVKEVKKIWPSPHE